MQDAEKPATDAVDCESMGQVRAEIDRIDRQLVRLIAERQGYIEAAARIKAHVGEVRVEWRIEDVVTKVLAAAEREGLSADIAEPVWRTMIERCIAHEFECWHGLRAAGEAKRAS
ncbi:MAG: hypothetical protein A3E78_14710 [Alphaproteobacteria bacterium RIFCSPHIGHO2_12_FULL_63_12]|nr:MAG: hypothetical protein A3E78_14710 [Alphaproteobacteria bacterium RIFCSPHIGHO2_12_FULL_63_12]